MDGMLLPVKVILEGDELSRLDPMGAKALWVLMFSVDIIFSLKFYV